MGQDKQDKDKPPNRGEAAAASFKWAFSDARSRALKDELMSIVTAPLYIPSKNMSIQDVAFLEGRRSLAAEILKSSGLLKE